MNDVKCIQCNNPSYDGLCECGGNSVLPASMDVTATQIKGALYGVAVGDALGAPWEGWRPKQLFGKFGIIKDMMQFDEPWGLGEFTDDTWLTLATARAYDGDEFSPSKAGLAMVIWMRSIGKGIGKLTNIALSNLSSGRCDVYNSGHKALASVGNRGASNGSLMKCISTGLIHSYKHRDIIEKESTVLSEITHADPRCVAACVGYNIVVAGLLDNKNPIDLMRVAQDEIKNIDKEASDIFGYVADGEKSRFDPSIMKEIGYVFRALDRSLIACRDAISFEDEIIKIVNEGGDTDTNAAIAGGLLGARFGYNAIPKRWIDPLLNKDEIDDTYNVIMKYRSKQ
jgi:ADP-ribosyl-[dinitrogen reductase] hydrolase